MARIRVITDSACDLSAEVAAELGVTVVPLSIRFGEEEFVDGRDLTTEEFWARCKASAVLPETSAPSPGAFQDAYLAAAADGYDGVLSLSLSGGVSATYQSALAAAKSVAGQIEVRAIDSRSMTMGLGLMVFDIADLAATGADLDALELRVKELVPRTQVFGAVETLEHLEKGGRIGGARALLGSLLSIKPVVHLVDGEVAEESKQRTRHRSLQYLADKALSSPSISRIAIAHGAASDIDAFLDMLSDVKAEHPIVVSQLGPVVGTHTGPGTIGLCMILEAQ
jgi:DegV family protein with EDD domain